MRSKWLWAALATVEVGIGHDQWPSLAAVAVGGNAPSLAMALIASGDALLTRR
jgi:hypothetical protein